MIRNFIEVIVFDYEMIVFDLGQLRGKMRLDKGLKPFIKEV